MIIVGAGLSGLIAAHVWPHATVLEQSAAPQPHRALLRFRSDAVSLVTGVPFRRVRVHKGIYDDAVGALVPPNIALANQYATKVTPIAGRISDRSVWSTEAVDRYVAPDDLQQRLLDNVGSRIRWHTPASVALLGADPIVNTAPLDWAAQEFLGEAPSSVFRRAPIYVSRWRLADIDLFQTIYFPSLFNSVYRASITGDALIVESVSDAAVDLQAVLGAFGLNCVEAAPEAGATRSNGKIAPIDDRLRRELIHQLSIRCGVYSLGRYATWRNVLLDDVVKDCRVITGLMQQDGEYGKRLLRAGS